MESDESSQTSSSDSNLSIDSQNSRQSVAEEQSLKHDNERRSEHGDGDEARSNSNAKSTSGESSSDDEDDDDTDDGRASVEPSDATSNEPIKSSNGGGVVVGRQASKHESESGSESDGSGSGSGSGSESGSGSGSASESEDEAETVKPRRSKSPQAEQPEVAAAVVEEVTNNNGHDEPHDDELSDVSDMESEKRPASELHDENGDTKDADEDASPTPPTVQSIAATATESPKKRTDSTSDEQSTENQSNNNKSALCLNNEVLKPHDEEALDFEAEEGECEDEEENELSDGDAKKSAAEQTKAKKGESNGSEKEEGEELEEGEISDEDERRQDDSEPKPICRFYTRGQCTWGMNCRFSHPGVTDKGNYTMFENVRSVPISQSGRLGGGGGRVHDYHDYQRNERPSLRPPPSHAYASLHSDRLPPPASHEPQPYVEKAWERGMRSAREFVRMANKRKEQDVDFEEKKMNLTSAEDFDKDPYYVKDRAPSPPPPVSYHRVYSPPPPPERYARPPAPYHPHYEEVDAYGRMARYRELPPERMPQYEDEHRFRPQREVIVQRPEVPGRGDDWNDPWMRAKSPGGPPRVPSYERDDRRRRRDRRSFSSHSSYSSSDSSKSYSSSGSSHSGASKHRRQQRHRLHRAASNSRPRNLPYHRSVSRSPQRVQRSTSRINSHAPTRHAVYEKRNVHSPAPKRKRSLSPPPPPLKREQYKRRRDQSSSDSDSSASSGSNSGSGSSSSNSTLSTRRIPAKSSRDTQKAVIPRERPPPKRAPISIEIKKPSTVGPSALKSPSRPRSPVSDRESRASDRAGGGGDSNVRRSRRDELLKQLAAVENAIAKKRSKLN